MGATSPKNESLNEPNESTYWLGSLGIPLTNDSDENKMLHDLKRIALPNEPHCSPLLKQVQQLVLDWQSQKLTSRQLSNKRSATLSKKAR